ncbi:T9SS type A sorting domain-containing protein, partial [Dyadobacter sp. CY312]|uniref:T9SS type A sorting domain-containing protein n=1 Tax=Dyadobacter sp. CY312 TaxID=2907303 RepID=UPI001F2A3F7C
VVVTPLNYTVGQTANLQATALTGATLNWYGTSATGGTSTAIKPVPSTATPGTEKYYVSQTIGTCESPRSEIVVNVAAVCATPAPVVVTPLNYTVGQTANLQATALTGATLNWYGTSATGGTSTAIKPVPSTTTPGTVKYYVSQTIGTCESPRSEIVVNVAAVCATPAPVVVTPLNYTVGQTANLQATALAGATLNWYGTSATGGTSTTTKPVPSTTIPGTVKYYVSQTIGICESPRSEIVVNVTAACIPPAAPTVTSPVSYTVGQVSISLTATGTGNFIWYTVETGGVGTKTAPKPSTDKVGTTSYWVSQSTTATSCESARAKIDVVVSCPAIAKPTVSTITPVCQNQTVASNILSAAVTPKTDLLWYLDPTGGAGSGTVPTVVTTTSGIKSYYVSQRVNGCESERAPLTLEVKALPAVPTVTPVAYCKDVTGATPLVATGTGLKWYTAATGGAALTQTPTPSTTTVGTIPYYVSQTTTYTGTTLTCEGPRAKLDVVTNPLPAAPVAFSDALCQEKEDKTFTFGATPTAGNSIVWYSAATGTGVASTSLNLKTPGETTIYAVQKTTATGCESPTRAVYKMRVKPLPAVPGITTPLIEYCQFLPAAALTAVPQASATLNWYGTSATGGNASPTAPIPSTAEGGTTSYYVGQTLEGCLGDRAKIDVKINTTPKPVTQTYLAYCQGVVAPRLDATGTVLKWYRQATDTEFQGFPYTPFTEKVEDYSFWVTQTGANNCESPKEEIKIHIKALPSATISGSKEVSLGEQATISLAFTGDGPWKYILSSGDTGTTSQSPATVNVTPTTTTTYFVTEVSNECGKGSPIGSAQITVKVPTIITGSPSVAETCAGTSFTVPFQRSGDFPAGNTFKVQIAQVNEDAAFYSIPSVPGLNTIVATFPDTTKGGNYFVRVVNSGSNPAFTAKGSVNTVGIAAIPLPVATLTGTQTVLIGSPATLKVEITGKGPWTFTLSDGTKDSVITAAASPYSFLVTPKVTSTYTIKTVSNTCGVGRGAGSARVQVDPILGVEPPVTDWLKVYPTITNAECTVEITTTIANKDARIQILDLKGRPVHEQNIRQKSTQLDFTKYPAGLYLIQVQNGNLRSVNRVMKP